MLESRIQSLSEELNELKSRRIQALNSISQLEEQLGKAVQFKTKIDGAIEWVESVYKKEVDAEKTRKTKEVLKVPDEERLTSPQ